MGDITATSMVSAEPIEGATYMRRLKGGILGDGVNSLIASICGTFPIVTPAQNNGIIQLTGVGSRYVGYFIAGILVIAGLFPLVGGVLLAIPTSVFGGAVMLMFGTVAVAGFNILREVKMDNRAFIILAVSLSAGLGVTFLPEALEHFPLWCQEHFGIGYCYRFNLRPGFKYNCSAGSKCARKRPSRSYGRYGGSRNKIIILSA